MSEPVLEVRTPLGVRRMPMGPEPITVGRQIANMLVLEDEEASRFHCVVERVNGGYRVRDLGSRNGTKLNGRLVKTAAIQDRDVIQIGKCELRILGNGFSDHGSSTEEFNEPGFIDEKPEEPVAPTATTQGPSPVIRTDGPPAQNLLNLAESLPEKAFNHYDIALLNARGQVAHAGGATARKSEVDAGEAVTLLRLLLLVCFRTRASDVHIEPKTDMYLVRVRIDGTMVDAAKLKKESGIRLAAVIKILCDIDISQRNIVQEGHFGTRVPDRRVDYRVSFTPSLYGQKCVIRVLDTANSPRYLWDLRLPEWMFNDIDRTIRGDSGMVLVCGPTGSGKTASLYATLRSIDAGERNVVTIEDPVEIQLEGITQLPVNEEQGNTFPSLLRSVLRQDPDVVLVGEVRDGETARVAMQAAMTGHLVFSTVHARDTVGTIFRLMDLGIEPYLIASGLQIVMAQRLVRRLCPYCKVGMRPTPEQAAKLEPVAGKVGRLFRSNGCPRCLGTGFAGRQGVFEVLTITEAVREAIQKTPTPGDIHKHLDGSKFVRLLQSGYKLVAEGSTTIDEVERVVGT